MSRSCCSKNKRLRVRLATTIISPPAFKDTGTGYASGWALTNRYQMWNPYVALGLSVPQHVGNDEMQDKVNTDVLQMLLPFLPSSNSKPVPELVALFRLSLLIDCAAVLMRNDSITDMTKRKNLYHALFAFLTTITKCRPLVDILLEQRPTKKRSPGLQALGEEANRKSLTIDASPEGLAPSLVSCGREAYKHAKAFADLTKNAAISTEAKLGSNSLTLCVELLDFYKTVKKTAPSVLDAMAPPSNDSWVIYAEENRVTSTDDVLEGHLFQMDFRRLNQSPRGRMAFLWKELTTLTSSL